MQQDDEDCRIQFRDHWLYEFYKFGKANRKIPPALHSPLGRKLDMLNAADEIKDLKSPPGNRLEKLNPPLTGFFSVRVNDKYRLIFRWENEGVEELYLDPHDYK